MNREQGMLNYDLAAHFFILHPLFSALYSLFLVPY
jgi:hypothetical protein